MFPIAHAWLIRQLTADVSPAHMLGCIWPDMLFESPLTHPQSHRSGARLAVFAADPAGPGSETFHQFVMGVLSHGSEPHGFDWYSDEQYGDRAPEDKGFAFQRALPLASAAARACDVDARDGWWKAHNLVEMAFEHTLHRTYPELGEALTQACGSDGLIRDISVPLARFYGVPAEALAHAMRRFTDVSALKPASPADLARVYALQVRIKHPGAVPDERAIAGLIDYATDEIADERDSYLAHCVSEVRALVNRDTGEQPS